MTLDPKLRAAMDVVQSFGFVVLPREAVKTVHAQTCVPLTYLWRFKSEEDRAGYEQHVRHDMARSLAHRIMEDSELFNVRSELNKKFHPAETLTYSADLKLINPNYEEDWIMRGLRRSK